MRSSLSRRIAKMERERAARARCPVCQDRGMPTVRWEGDTPPGVEDRIGHCRACGREGELEIVMCFTDGKRGWWNVREDDDQPDPAALLGGP